MARSSKIVSSILIVVGISLVWLAFAMSHNSAAAPVQAIRADAVRMDAIVYRQYGSPDVLKLEQIEKPTPAANELLIKVHDASLNPLEWHYMRGTPYLMRLQVGMGRPKVTRLGIDVSGTVEAVGADVKQFKVGDEIFGAASGALAQYVTTTVEGLALKPSNISFAQAAAVPIAAITALQGLRDKGQIKAGQKVLINGASGGVGTFAVQLAKYYGADVTGVCSTRNVDLVRSLGADHVIDYTKEDFTKGSERYDLIFDAVGNHALLDYRHVLNPHGIFVIIGAQSGDPWLGPLTSPIKAYVISPFVSQKFGMLMADVNRTSDLELLRDLMQAGKVTPIIDRQYPLKETPAAMRYLEQGHARGKVIVNLE
jgi:NADPH:quinone reductase-like Zn-dependent oxidoreductase